MNSKQVFVVSFFSILLGIGIALLVMPTGRSSGSGVAQGRQAPHPQAPPLRSQHSQAQEPHLQAHQVQAPLPPVQPERSRHPQAHSPTLLHLPPQAHLPPQ